MSLAASVSANTNPLFGLTGVIGLAQIGTANTNRDGTGNMSNLVFGDIYGTRVDIINIVATGSTTNGVVRFFIVNGSTTALWKEVLTSIVTPSTGVTIYNSEIVRTDGKPLLVLSGNTQFVKVSTNNAEGFNIFAFGSSF